MLTLLIRMPAAESQETEWLVVDEAGLRAGPSQRGPLTLAAAVAQNHRIAVLVPSTDVLLAQPDLPPGNVARLAKTVPYALEEQLTDDIDSLHFAIGRRAGGTATPVAVVRRDLVQRWLAELGAAGLKPSAMYADASLLPDNPAQTVLWAEGSRLSVRRPARAPFTVDIAPIQEALEAAHVLGGSSATEATLVAGAEVSPVQEAAPDNAESERDAPTELHDALFYCTPADWSQFKDEVGEVIDRFAALKVQLLAEGALPWLAQQLPGPQLINILQGEFAQASEHSSQFRRWRVAAGMLLALVTVHAAADGYALYQAKQQSKRLDQELAGLIASTLPGTPVEEARRVMQARLKAIRSGGGGDQVFLRTLQQLSAAMSKQSKASVDALSFRESTLDLKVTAPNVETIAQLSQAISTSGLTAEIQSSAPAGSAVEGRLQVRHAPQARRP